MEQKRQHDDGAARVAGCGSSRKYCIRQALTPTLTPDLTSDCAAKQEQPISARGPQASTRVLGEHQRALDESQGAPASGCQRG